MQTIHSIAPNTFIYRSSRRFSDDAVIEGAKLLDAATEEGGTINPEKAATIIAAHCAKHGAKSDRMIAWESEADLAGQIRHYYCSSVTYAMGYIGANYVPQYAVRARELLAELPEQKLSETAWMFGPHAHYPKVMSIRDALFEMADFVKISVAEAGETYLAGAEEEDESELQAAGDWREGDLLTVWLEDISAAK